MRSLTSAASPSWCEQAARAFDDVAEELQQSLERDKIAKKVMRTRFLQHFLKICPRFYDAQKYRELVGYAA